MYDIKWIRENRQAFDEGLRRRGLEPLSNELLSLDNLRRTSIAKSQALQERRNTASKEIGAAIAKKDVGQAEALRTEVLNLKSELAARELEQRTVTARLEEKLADIPNVPLPDVPVGKDENDNVELRAVGAKPRFSFKPKEHFEIGEALGLMDFETAAKISGARFVILKGVLARLERALSQFMLDLHTSEHDYTEVNPPLLVRDEAMFGTAQLPKFADDQFPTKIARERIDPEPIATAFEQLLSKGMESGSTHEFRTPLVMRDENVNKDERLLAEFRKKETIQLMRNSIAHANTDPKAVRNYLTTLLAKENFETLWLIPTAEVPLTNLVRESILDEKQLPLRFTAATPCFRAEAGAAGKDTRGMIRLHQFTKVELVAITTPETSLAEHERMLANAEEVLKRLGLPYRVVTLSTGDMGFASQKTYDIEVWLPGQDRYREISSVSVCGDFQARRMSARYRDGAKSMRFVHTLNGSGVAVGRALVAILENYQNEDGSVTVPDVLSPYMGGIKKIEKTG